MPVQRLHVTQQLLDRRELRQKRRLLLDRGLKATPRLILQPALLRKRLRILHRLAQGIAGKTCPRATRGFLKTVHRRDAAIEQSVALQPLLRGGGALGAVGDPVQVRPPAVGQHRLAGLAQRPLGC